MASVLPPESRTVAASPMAGAVGLLVPLGLACAIVLWATSAPAQAPSDDRPASTATEKEKAEPASTAKTESASAEALATQERQLSDRFKRLEEVLLRMAELSAPSDPRRATLLRKAVAQSKEEMIALQFEQLVGLLEKDQLSRAIENQGALQGDLKSLLELLMSENRAKRIESEKARLSAYLKQINQILRQQRSIHGRTSGTDDPKPLSREQGQLADKTRQLGQQMKDHEEAAKPGAADSASGKPEPSPGKPEATPAKPGESSKPKPGESSKPKPGESSKPKPGESSKPKPGGTPSPGQAKPSEQQKSPSQEGAPQSQEGEPQSKPTESPQGPSQAQGSPSQSSQPDEQEPLPARKRVEAAQQRMRQAQQKLEEAQRKEAIEEQEAAMSELEQAKADLERILRQLREEEMQRVLALLEARFMKMLQMQREVLEGTVRLDKVPVEDRTHNHEIEAGRLSTREVEIVVEADKALLLLHEDGTAAAFPEAVAQMRQDMQQVVQRLAEGKVNQITQSLEEEIITALEEMIEAFKQAQKKLDEQRQRPPQPGGDPDDAALVDTLAELKMIRALQMRVNSRTQRYSKLIEGEQTESAELLEALRRLSEREERIHQITRDLELGKNR